MRLIKIISLSIIFVFILTLILGCRLAPTEEIWYLSSYKKSMTFMGGLETKVGFAQASVVYPFANADFRRVSIYFGNNGSFSFITCDGEIVNGTFTYEHVGNYTTVYFETDTGETFKGDCMKMLVGDKYLIFDYKDITYTFSPVRREDGPTMEQIVQMVRNGEESDLYPATVIKQEDMYVARFSDMIYYNITSETYVYAVEIYPDGTYAILDAVKEGEVRSTYNDSGNYIILYYLNSEN